MGAPSEPARLLFLSDLHVLSRYGLVPPSHWLAGDGETLPSSHFYEYNWACWQRFCHDCPPIDVAIINGDLIEGETPSRKSVLDAITDDLLQQAQAAVETVGLLRDKIKELWIIRGTAFHDSRHYEPLEIAARDLGAEKWTKNRYTGLVWDAEWRGLKINALHAMSGNAIYQGTVMDRELLFAAAAAGVENADKVEIFARAHIHSPGKFESADGRWLIITPSWKSINQYVIERIGLHRALAKGGWLGADLLEVSDDGTKGWRSFRYPAYRWERRHVGSAPDQRASRRRPHLAADRHRGRAAR